MVRDICRISYDDFLTTNDSNKSRSTSEEISILDREYVTFTPDTVFENHELQKNTGCVPGSSNDC